MCAQSKRKDDTRSQLADVSRARGAFEPNAPVYTARESAYERRDIYGATSSARSLSADGEERTVADSLRPRVVPVNHRACQASRSGIPVRTSVPVFIRFAGCLMLLHINNSWRQHLLFRTRSRLTQRYYWSGECAPLRVQRTFLCVRRSIVLKAGRAAAQVWAVQVRNEGSGRTDRLR